MARQLPHSQVFDLFVRIRLKGETQQVASDALGIAFGSVGGILKRVIRQLTDPAFIKLCYEHSELETDEFCHELQLDPQDMFDILEGNTVPQADRIAQVIHDFGIDYEELINQLNTSDDKPEPEPEIIIPDQETPPVEQKVNIAEIKGKAFRDGVEAGEKRVNLKIKRTRYEHQLHALRDEVIKIESEIAKVDEDLNEVESYIKYFEAPND